MSAHQRTSPTFHSAADPLSSSAMQAARHYDESALLRALAEPAHTLRNYSARKLRRDVVAGVTVSVVELPQAMAYALIAGVPPQYGIYTSVIQGTLGALFSSSHHMTTGPTNTQSLL